MKDQLKLTQWFYQYSTLFLLIVPLLVLAILTGLVHDLLITRIVTVLFINLILVVSLQMFMGNSGILSFVHVGFMGIGAYASVIFSMTPDAKAQSLPDLYGFLRPIHLPFLPSLLIGAFIAMLLAGILTYPLMRLSDAAAVITLFALLVIINTVLVHYSILTNGPRTLFGVDNYTTLANSTIFGLAAILLAYLFKESPIGLKLRASRDDRYAAASIGVNIVQVRWISFTLSAFLAGFAGGLWAHFITSFSPYAFYLSQTFTILTMLVVGGTGGASGAVIGTVLVTVVHEALRGIENSVNIAQKLPFTLVGFTEVFLSVALILILIYRPSGIMGGRELRWPQKEKPHEAALPLEEAKDAE